MRYYPQPTRLNDIIMTTLYRRFIYIFLTLLLLASNGCYKIDIRQGNFIEQATVDRLQLGMSKQQVVRLLGTPMVVDPFHLQRWDYIYTFYPRGNQNQGQRRHLSLFFEGDSLSRIEGDSEPPVEPVPDGENSN